MWRSMNLSVNAVILKASIPKKLLEQKIRLLDHPACSPDHNPIENVWGLIVAKVYEGDRQYSAISELKNATFNAWEKYVRFNFKIAFIFNSSDYWSSIYVKTKF